MESVTILGLCFLAIALVRSNQIKVTFIQQTHSEWVRVIGFIADETPKRLINKYLI